MFVTRTSSDVSFFIETLGLYNVREFSEERSRRLSSVRALGLLSSNREDQLLYSATYNSNLYLISIF